MEHDEKHEERRYFARIPFGGKVAIIGEHSQWLADLMDISMKGVLIARPAEWHGQPGDHFHLRLNLSENKLIINMDASLAHSSNECLGFCCEHIDLESMTHLRRLLELNIGDEDRINHELSALLFMHHNHAGKR